MKIEEILENISEKIKITDLAEESEITGMMTSFATNKENWDFRKGPRSYSTYRYYIEDDVNFEISKFSLSQWILRLLEKKQIEKNIDNYGASIISLVKYSYLHSKRKYSRIFSIYDNPDYILLNDFTFSPTEFNEIYESLDLSTRNFLEELKNYYDLIREIYKENVINFMSIPRWFDESRNFFFNSVDIFVSLIIHCWSIIIDPEGITTYKDSLRVYLNDFFASYTKQQNINDYFKIKFKLAFYNENLKHKLGHHLCPVENVKNILNKKQFHKLETLFHDSNNYFEKTDIIYQVLMGNIEELDKFIISQLKSDDFPLNEFIYFIITKNRAFVERNQSSFIEMLTMDRWELKKYAVYLINSFSIEIEAIEDKISYFHSSKKWQELGEIKHEKAYSIILSSLKDPNPDVKIAAISAISNIPLDQSVPVLLDLLEYPHPKVKTQTLLQMKDIIDDRLIEPLKVYIENKDNPQRNVAIEILANFTENNDLISYFEGLFHIEYNRFNWSAMKGLVRNTSETSFNLVKEFLEYDENKDEKSEPKRLKKVTAISIIGEVGSTRYREILEQMYSNHEGHNRFLIFKSLLQLYDESKISEHLEFFSNNYLDKENYRSFKSFLITIKDIEHPKVDELMLEGLHSEKEVYNVANEYLKGKQTKDKQFISKIIPYFVDPDVKSHHRRLTYALLKQTDWEPTSEEENLVYLFMQYKWKEIADIDSKKSNQFILDVLKGKYVSTYREESSLIPCLEKTQNEKIISKLIEIAETRNHWLNSKCIHILSLIDHPKARNFTEKLKAD